MNLDSISERLLRGIYKVPVNLFKVKRNLEQLIDRPISIVRLPMRDGLEGFVYLDDLEYRIVVNARMSRTRQRTTIAHEFGEIVLGLEESYFSKQFLSRNREREAVAFRLGRAILVPRKLATDLVELYRNTPAAIIKVLYEHCRVSLDVACLRILDLSPSFRFILLENGNPVFDYGYARGQYKESVFSLGRFTLVGRYYGAERKAL